MLSTAELDTIDQRHSWHPFTQMEEYLGLPRLHLTRGEGSWLFDNEGKRYLDANASIWTNVHGHSHPELLACLQEQAQSLCHATWLGLSHEAGCRLQQALLAIAPDGLERISFSDNGSNAIEIALKQSFQYWQLTGQPAKRLAVCMEGAYHGDTFGTMAVSGSEAFHGRFKPWCFEALSFPAPSCEELQGEVRQASMEDSLNALKALFAQRAEEIACLVLEPSIQGAAGMRLQPPGFLREVARLCREHAVHLILDEVFTGFGRTGSLLVCEAEGVCPDFLCLAKGLSAGYLPLAATLTRESIYQAYLGKLESGRAFMHGHTFSANPLACAVAHKSLELLEARLESGALTQTVEDFGAGLAAHFDGHPLVCGLRQRGLAAAIDLVPNSPKGYPTGTRPGMAVAIEARQHAILIRPLGNSLLLVPPLTISKAELDHLFTGLKASVENVLTN